MSFHSRLEEIVWTLVRVTFGAMLAVEHGYAKVFRGGVHSLQGMVAELGFPFPVAFAWAASLSEFVGGILVALGLATRPAAGLAAFTMVVATYSQRHELSRMELSVLYLAVFLIFAVAGGGPFALDRVLRVRNPIVSRRHVTHPPP